MDLLSDLVVVNCLGGLDRVLHRWFFQESVQPLPKDKRKNTRIGWSDVLTICWPMIFDKWLSASDAGDDNQRQTRLTRKIR